MHPHLDSLKPLDLDLLRGPPFAALCPDLSTVSLLVSQSLFTYENIYIYIYIYTYIVIVIIIIIIIVIVIVIIMIIMMIIIVVIIIIIIIMMIMIMMIMILMITAPRPRGFFLGIVTNWLAIFMCFEPCHPHPVHLFGRPAASGSRLLAGFLTDVGTNGVFTEGPHFHAFCNMLLEARTCCHTLTYFATCCYTW